VLSIGKATIQVINEDHELLAEAAQYLTEFLPKSSNLLGGIFGRLSLQ
jgi:hypothetical protein